VLYTKKKETNHCREVQINTDKVFRSTECNIALWHCSLQSNKADIWLQNMSTLIKQSLWFVLALLLLNFTL